MLKWYVDRITEAERQEHIQEVLKVTPDEASGGAGCGHASGNRPLHADRGGGWRSLHPEDLTRTTAAAELGTLEGTRQARPLHPLGLNPSSSGRPNPRGGGWQEGVSARTAGGRSSLAVPGSCVYRPLRAIPLAFSERMAGLAGATGGEQDYRVSSFNAAHLPVPRAQVAGRC